MNKNNQSFTLYDLRVEVTIGAGRIVCAHKPGGYFEVRGENLYFPNDQPFSLYALAALLPLLPAKQRMTDPADWMTTDSEIACPDPHCDTLFTIRRVNKRSFNHDDVTAVPL
jgi:uncharacterized repeat protein (TIGR04076 family)